MKKVLALLIILALAFPAHAADQWREGSGADIDGSAVLFNNIDSYFTTNVIEPLDDLLANYNTIKLVYNSASQITASAGEVTVSNSAGSIRLMLRNSSSTTVTWSDIDTGSEASGTSYYVYAIAASTSATSATFKISTSSTAPSGATYYKRIGSFTNNGSSNIESVANDDERVKITTGTVSDGGTISLPSGWSSDECSWTVGAGTIGLSAGTDDNLIYNVAASVNSSRVATCQVVRKGPSGTGITVSGTCNYIVACTR